MTALPNHFAYFLDGTVNLNQSRIDLLDGRLEAVERFLTEHETFGELMVGDELIPQGSYAHKTIIKPLVGRDFDVDLLVPMRHRSDAEPCDYIADLYAALRSGSYREMTSRKTRCVTVQYANDFHIDLVPYVERFGANYIVNRHENVFELSDPERFSAWLEEQNRVAGGYLVETIRLFKFLRDYKGTFTARSIILTALLGDRVNFVNLLSDSSYYGDSGTAFKNVVSDLDTYLQAHEELPVIPDPGGTGEDYSYRWDQSQYANFRNRLHRYTELVREAYDEEDDEKSVAKWQAIFGDGFRSPPESKALVLKEAAAPAPREQFLDRDFGIPTRLGGYRLRVVGRVNRQPGFRTYDLPSQGNVVLKHRQITFRIDRCDVPEPFDVYWKVRNRGAEAAGRSCLRGEITHGGRTKVEPTAYRGSHWVECYIVKDGVCVAVDRHPVIIR